MALGRALLMKPRLMLLDEPMASLDAARNKKFYPISCDCATRRKLPMIYVSHDAAEVKRIATRVVRIEGGQVTATGGVELLSA
ncbi:MAG: hypothetical protein WDN48_16400 [Pseudolabrys sp.]